MYSFLLNRSVSEDTVVPCYFFYGEEDFLAHQFVSELKKTLISEDVQEYNVERFDLDENSWAEVIDLARTIPFFLSPWRIIVVEASQGKKESLSAVEEKILKDYFDSPSAQTVIVIIFSGKIKKNSPLFKFFSSFSSSVVFSKELRPLKQRTLHAWMDKKFSSQGKTATPEAVKRLEEITGNDLRRINSELEKLITYVGQKNVIELDDVNQISGRVKTFYEWEMSDSLSKADLNQCLVVLDNLFKEGTKPEYVLGSVVRFFRDIFQAKLLIKEKDIEKKAIFRDLRPHIQEKFGNFYAAKLKEFFVLVERFSLKDLSRMLSELEKIDMRMKTSSLNPKTLLEAFLSDYCRFREKERITWREGS